MIYASKSIYIPASRGLEVLYACCEGSLLCGKSKMSILQGQKIRHVGFSTSVRPARPSAGIFVVQTAMVLPCKVTSPLESVSTSGLFNASMKVLYVFYARCQSHQIQIYARLQR